MKIRLPHAPYMANKISIDLLNSGFVTLHSGLEPVTKIASDLIEEDIKKEMALEAKVTEILDENEDDMEFMQVDRRNMFWLIKKKLAKDLAKVQEKGEETLENADYFKRVFKLDNSKE